MTSSSNNIPMVAFALVPTEERHTYLTKRYYLMCSLLVTGCMPHLRQCPSPKTVC